MKYVRRNGSWTALVTLPDRSQRRVTAPTKGELDRRITSLKNSVAEGSYAYSGRLTLERLTDMFLASREQSLEPKTMQRYKSICALYIVPSLGHRQLSKLGPTDIDAAIAEWRDGSRKDGKERKNESRLSPRTVAHIFQTLRTVLNFAIRRRLIAVNPCTGVDPPRAEYREAEVLRPEEVARLVRVATTNEIGNAIVVLVGTGLRRQELLGLQWQDINFDNERLQVVRAWERVAGISRYKQPKTRRSSRTVALPRFVVEALKAQRVDQVKRFVAAGLGKPLATSAVFDQLENPGKPYNPATFSSKYARFRKKTGICVTVHGLRHTFGTLSRIAGADIKTISEAMGHSDIGVTANIYLHLVESLGRENAQRLDDLVRADQSTSEAS